ncbi:melanocyte-stimulating hormone receptor-like [Oculina patagonica]
MKKLSCEVHVLRYFPLVSEVEDFRSTYIANWVFNSFLCYNVIVLNFVTIHAIRKTSSLPKTLRTLLLSLAVSDVGVGLLAQPFYISLLVNGLQKVNPSCSTYKVFDMMMGLFPIASFLGVVAVSVDRFLAIQFHLRYQELVTHKRVVAVVISVWLLSVSSSLITLWLPSDFKFTTVCVGGVVGLLLTTMVYLKIYLVVRRHKNQIQTLQVQQVTQTGEMANFASLIKSAVGIFYVFLVFWICYLPFFISMAAIRIDGPSIALKKLFLLSVTLAYLNSSLNPVIYCWKMRKIRRAIIDILRNMPCHRKRLTGHGISRLSTFSAVATENNLNSVCIVTNERAQ